MLVGTVNKVHRWSKFLVIITGDLEGMLGRPHQPTDVAFLPLILEGARKKLVEAFCERQFDVVYWRINVNVLDEVLPYEGKDSRDYDILAKTSLGYCLNTADRPSICRGSRAPAKAASSGKGSRILNPPVTEEERSSSRIGHRSRNFPREIYALIIRLLNILPASSIITSPGRSAPLTLPLLQCDNTFVAFTDFDRHNNHIPSSADAYRILLDIRDCFSMLKKQLELRLLSQGPLQQCFSFPAMRCWRRRL
ncbi:hypothetical protein KSP39_PZI007300 [Platanthera zijinensis]|uniref:Uncharacterized protein n=1 Tax=Platanthera zijinensis TaxID=2320716 RepID=A0AAP0G9R6_9ASPA